MKCDYIILPDANPDGSPDWLRVVDGRIVRRGLGTHWLLPEEGAEGEMAGGRALVVLPPHVTTLHWIACPEMTVRQGAAAARVMAMEASIGTPGQLHAAVLPADTSEEAHIAAVTSESAMTHWTEWCADHGLAKASLVPAALLLPAPEAGFVCAQVGPNEVVRGVDSAFDGAEPVAELILGEEPVSTLSPEEVDTALLAALDMPPLDLRQGAFARRTARIFDRKRLTRIAVLIGFILLAALFVSLVRIAKLNMEASRLDAQTVALARTVDPNVADAADAELKLTARLAARGGSGGFTGVMAGIMSAMRANPAVTLTSVSQVADGSLRVQLAGSKAEDLNDVLLALQAAGWRISANAVQQRSGKLVVDIMVVR